MRLPPDDVHCIYARACRKGTATELRGSPGSKFESLKSAAMQAVFMRGRRSQIYSCGTKRAREFRGPLIFRYGGAGKPDVALPVCNSSIGKLELPNSFRRRTGADEKPCANACAISVRLSSICRT
jgi:hypothetical protein